MPDGWAGSEAAFPRSRSRLPADDGLVKQLFINCQPALASECFLRALVFHEHHKHADLHQYPPLHSIIPLSHVHYFLPYTPHSLGFPNML